MYQNKLSESLSGQWRELCSEYLYVIRNVEIRRRTRVTDIAQRVAKQVNAALVDSRRGGRTTLGASQEAAGFKREPWNLELPTKDLCPAVDVYWLI
ncbi:jg6280 [Pararge aegeria aegeria]|uniref:Jg6280 protein n=1 Tax=Pararge aegeria aegeria TaxID=348720 RepID=A0A8S4SH19_9NEOP|nr:jg6280 [Pararge aegeria aegeria]